MKLFKLIRIPTLILSVLPSSQAERERSRRNDYESDREGSASPGEDASSSPCARHNGSYKSHDGNGDMLASK